jgi:hypothetical protein
MEKFQEAPQRASQHAQESWGNTSATVPDEIGEILCLQGVKPERATAKAPLQKLSAADQHDTPRTRSQSGDLVQVAIILTEHLRSSRSRCLPYAEMSGTVALPGMSITT